MSKRNPALRPLLVAALTLVATGAWADNPHHDKDEKKAERGDKDDKKAERGDKDDKKAERAEKKDGGGDVRPGRSAEERAARKAKEHAEEREKLVAKWKGPVSDALRQEERRHAERLARLERIKDVATGENDKDSVDRATKLIAKENDRHDKWMAKHGTADAAKDGGK